MFFIYCILHIFFHIFCNFIFKLFEFYSICCTAFDFVLEAIDVHNLKEEIEYNEALEEFELQGKTFDAYIDYLDTVHSQI